MAYTLFTFSMFNRDTSNVNIFYTLTNIAKYAALIFSICGAVNTALSKKQFIGLLILLSADLIVTLRTGALLFIIITIFAYLAMKIDNKDICKLAFYTLLIYTLVTMLFCILGIYTDLITRRWLDSTDRHSFGFYHSNVVPLIYSYLLAYYLLIIQKKPKMRTYTLLILISFLIYHFCGSRNAVVISILLVIGKIISYTKWLDKGKTARTINKKLYYLAKYSVVFWGIITIIIPIFLKKSRFLNLIDFILSYRFTYIAAKIQHLGLNLFPKMTNEEYFADKIVIDNGYAFVTIRYGLLMLIILSMLVASIAHRYRNNTYVLIVILLITALNFVDNDIFDYSCLPFVIIGIKCLVGDVQNARKGINHV